MIEFQGVSKRYGATRVLDNLSLTIGPAEFFTLLGPSGAGKTTLLRLLAGLEQASEGTIRIGGEDQSLVPPHRRDVAMVFQNYALFPHMTVEQNIAYPLRLRRVAVEARVREVAEAFQIVELLSRKPSELSGGQQQRVALARSLAHKPRLFLFDEPLSNLDPQLRLEARTVIRDLQRKLNIPAVYVTHDQSEAMALSDRMAVLAEGRLHQVGTPLEVYHRPADAFVASFVGDPPMNLLRARRTGDGVRMASDGDVLLGVRAEAIRWDPHGPFPATVVVCEDYGHETLVTVDVQGQRAILRGQGIAPGTAGAISIDLAGACFYPTQAEG